MSSPSDSRQVDRPGVDIVPGRARRDGWTPERQRAFIARLRDCRCIGAAARSVGMSRESVYRLRCRPGASGFAAAIEAIMAQAPSRGPSRSELTWHRAFYGTVKPVVRGGEVVAMLHTPDNAAVLRLMGHLDRVCRGKGHADIFVQSGDLCDLWEEG